MSRDLTSGSIGKNLLVFSIPYLIACFLQAFYGLTDLFIIGQFEGAASTSAVAIGSQIIHLPTVMIVSLAMGTTVSLGHAVGSHDSSSQKSVIGTTLSLFMLGSLVLALVLYVLTNPILHLLSTPEEAFGGATDYLHVCFLGIPFIVAYNVLASIYRGLGDSRTPMVFVAIAGVFNIFLDWLLIGPFGQGASGAALATVISQGVSVILALFWLVRSGTVSLSLSDLKPDGKTARKVFGIGLPISLQDGFIQISFLLITMIVNRRGVVDAAAVGIVEKVISFLFLVPSAMLSSVSAIASQDFGAGKPRQAEQTMWTAMAFSFSFGLIVALAGQFCASWVVGLFTHDPLVITHGAPYLKSYLFDCALASIHFCFSGYFSAAGKSVYAFIHNVTSVLFVRIPGSWWASVTFKDTLLPLGCFAPLGSLTSSVICLLLFLHLAKKTAR